MLAVVIGVLLLIALVALSRGHIDCWVEPWHEPRVRWLRSLQNRVRSQCDGPTYNIENTWHRAIGDI